MTTSALVLLFALLIVMTALGTWNNNRRRQATTHNDPFRTAPRWAGVIHEQLHEVLAGQRRLHQHIGSEADADYERDRQMSAAHDAILAELTAAKTEQAGFLVILKALQANKDDPAKLQEIANSVATSRQDWVAAFAENVATE